jgi:hypothetical protein
VALLLASTLLAGAAGAQQPGEASGIYEVGRPNRDGIGTIYVGREISHVMGHQGAAWLERPEREREERTDLLIENLPIEAGDRIADIGAGAGYFSLPMARLTGDMGTVYAVYLARQALRTTPTFHHYHRCPEGTTPISLTRGLGAIRSLAQ